LIPYGCHEQWVTTFAVGEVTRAVERVSYRFGGQTVGTWTYEYDDLGRLTAQRDGNGQWLMYTYDVLGRQTRQFNGGTGSSPVQGAELSRWNYRTTITSPDVGLVIDSIANYNTTGEIKISNTYDQASCTIQLQLRLHVP